MPLIRCTKKLLKELKAKVAIAPEQPGGALLGDWYANLLWIERRKCVIFTSERTHLTFFVAGVNQDALRDFATFFRRGLRQLLEDEGFATAVVERVLDDYKELALAPTGDRSVLGSLNDLARLAAARAEYFGGLSRIPPGEMNHDLNLTPMGRLQMRSPIDATANVLEGRDPAAHRSRPRTPTGESLSVLTITSSPWTTSVPCSSRMQDGACASNSCPLTQSRSARYSRSMTTRICRAEATPSIPLAIRNAGTQEWYAGK